MELHTELQKNNALKCVSEAILKNKQEILNANQIDVENARAKGTSESLVERLALNEKKFNDILDGIKIVIQQKDPVGKIVDGWKAPNGMEIRQIRVPLGVAAIIYESSGCVCTCLQKWKFYSFARFFFCAEFKQSRSKGNQRRTKKCWKRWR